MKKGLARALNRRDGEKPSTDAMLVTAKELARALLVHEGTVRRWKREGYVFESGKMTTPGHCKAWLQKRVRKNARTKKPGP
jgi:hypothetical protein